MGARSILFDLRPCQRHRGRGIARYGQSLVQHILATRPDYAAFFLLTERLPVSDSLRSLLKLGPISYDHRSVISDPDVFFLTDCFTALDQLYPSTPLVPLRVAQSSAVLFSIFYDAIPAILPERYLPGRRDKARYRRAGELLRRCERIFAISETSRLDAMEHFGIKAHRIETIYGGLGDDRIHRTDATASISIRHFGQLAPIELPAGEFFLGVSGQDWRKNNQSLVEGYALYRQSNAAKAWPLVLTGSLEGEIESVLGRVTSWSGLLAGKDIIVTGVLDDAKLTELQAATAATVLSSIYEGLGLPALESYAAGRPVLGSDTSSLRELVAPGCHFQATEPATIAAKLTEFVINPALGSNSLAYGRELLGRYHWRNAATSVIARLDAVQIIPSRPTPVISPQIELALYTSLPPAESGVADATWNTFGAWPGSLHVFGEMPAFGDLVARQRELRLEPAQQRRVFPLQSAREISKRISYGARLFVLGNSPHHVPVSLELAHAARQGVPVLVHLHEAQMTGFWFSYLGDELQALKSLYCTFYPERSDCFAIAKSCDDIVAIGALGLRPFCTIFQVSDLLVNSRYAQEMVEQDLAGWSTPRLHTVFLPIFPETPLRSQVGGDRPLTIGHFGIPSPLKGGKLLIQACAIISRTRAVKLIFAGHDARKRVAAMLERTLPFIEIIESPGPSEFHQAMDAVDLAVQLRLNPHGESSGAVHALLGRGQRVIVSASANYLDYGDAVIRAPAEVTPEQLAALILATAGRDLSVEIARVAAEYSVERFYARLREISASFAKR